MNKKLIYTTFLFCSLLSLSLRSVSAQGLTDDLKQVEQTVKDTVQEVSKQLSGETSSDSAENKKTIDTIKKRLERAVEQERVQGDMDVQPRKYGFVGEVVRVSEETITISNQTSTTIIPLKEVMLLKARKQIELSEVTVGSWTTVMGYMDSEGTFQPKALVVSAESLHPNPKIVHLGTVLSIDAKKIIVNPRSSKLDEQTFILNSKTVYQDTDGSSATRSEFETDAAVLVVGQETESAAGVMEKTAAVIRSLAPLEKSETASP